MTLDELIAELKRRHGLTDTEIAATLGISERTIHRWTKTGTGYPSEQQLQVLRAMFTSGGKIKQTLDALFTSLLDEATASRV